MQQHHGHKGLIKMRLLSSEFAVKHRNYVQCFSTDVESMVVAILTLLASSGMSMPTSLFTFLYCRVYEACTRRPLCRTADKLIYKALSNPGFVESFAAGKTEPEKNYFGKYIDLVFMYVNRFYVKRNSLPIVREVLPF